MKQKLNIAHMLYLLVAVALVLAAWAALRPKAPTIGAVAVIRVEGKEIRHIPLEDAEDQEFSILDETGRDITFQVKDHAIRFLHSDCPDKVCVHTGFIHGDGDIATCLPNQTVLTVSAEEISPG